MFGTFSSLTALSHLQGEHKRPSSPTGGEGTEKKPRVPRPPLTFPHCYSDSSSSSTSHHSSSSFSDGHRSRPFPSPNEFYTLFQRIRRANNISREHLRALNISISYEVPLSQLIPTKYHADESPDDPNSLFNQRKAELDIDNRAAFDYIARLRRDVKVGNFYKFYQALEYVTTYYGPDATESGNMPGRFREEAVRYLIDPMGWATDARIYPPRSAPKILVRNSLFDLKMDYYIFHLPKLPMERKEGIIEGPMVAIQSRHEDEYDENQDILDTMREVAALIALGQERGRKKGIVARKIRYEAIGREKGLLGDDLFLISCVNHHISISHVFLYDAYLHFIRTGELPPAEFQDAHPDWCEFRLGKTPWYSFLDGEGRIDCLRAVLAVNSYLLRYINEEKEKEKAERDAEMANR